MINQKHHAKVMSFSNYKGGSGKTTTTALVGTELARFGYKVLTIDMDAQANLTSVLYKTAGYAKDGLIQVENSFMQTLYYDRPLTDNIVPILRDNVEGELDIIPNTAEFMNYEMFLYNKKVSFDDKVKFLKQRIEPLKQDYDFIFLDLPPALGLPNLTAFYACDYVAIVLKTAELSFDGANVLISYLKNVLVDSSLSSNIEVIGILPVIEENNSYLDKRVIRNATQQFGPAMFKNAIYKMKRIERYTITGIQYDEKDQWDRKVEEQFSDVTKELLEKLKEN